MGRTPCPPRTVSLQSDGSPHPVPPCPGSSRFASCSPRGLVWPCVASCGLPFLSCCQQSETETETGKQRNEGRRPERKRNRQRLKAERNSGTLAAQERNGTERRNGGRKRPTAGRKRKPETEGSPKRKGKVPPFPSLPSFQHSRFPFLSRSCTRERKTIFPPLRYVYAPFHEIRKN